MATNDVSKRPTVLSAFSVPTNNHAYLFKRRAFTIALTTLFALTLTGLSIRGIVDLYHKKSFVRNTLPGGTLHAVPILGVTGTAAAAGGLAALSLIALITSAMFGLQKVETRKTLLAKDAWLAFCWVAMTAAAIALTIIGGTKSATVTSSILPQDTVNYLIYISGQHLEYRKNSVVVVPAIIFAWLTWLGLSISIVWCSLAARHIHKHGAEPTVGAEIVGEKPHRQQRQQMHATTGYKQQQFQQQPTQALPAPVAAPEKTLQRVPAPSPDAELPTRQSSNDTLVS